MSGCARSADGGPTVSDQARMYPGIYAECVRKFGCDARFPRSRSWSSRSVNPSRKLRRFESFTCHTLRKGASDLRKRRSEALLQPPGEYLTWRVSDTIWRPRDEVSDLRKRGSRGSQGFARAEYARKFGLRSVPPRGPSGAWPAASVGEGVSIGDGVSVRSDCLGLPGRSAPSWLRRPPRADPHCDRVRGRPRVSSVFRLIATRSRLVTLRFLLDGHRPFARALPCCPATDFPMD